MEQTKKNLLEAFIKAILNYDYQINVATAPGFISAFADMSFRLMVTSRSEPGSFRTITTILPSGVLKATFDILSGMLEAILTEPGATNFDAWAYQFATGRDLKRK